MKMKNKNRIKNLTKLWRDINPAFVLLC